MLACTVSSFGSAFDHPALFCRIGLQRQLHIQYFIFDLAATVADL